MTARKESVFERPLDRALWGLRLAGFEHKIDPERLDRWESTCPNCADRLEVIEGTDHGVTFRCAGGCDPYVVKVAIDLNLPPGDGACAVPLASIRRERVEWLWRERVPIGMLTLLIGDPGLGKSLWTLALASEVSRTGSGVLILSAEDHAGATIRPRVEAAGGDLNRIHVVTVRRDGLEDGLALPDDAPQLAELVAGQDARLVVVDPLMAHLPESVNSWRDQSVRRAMAPLHRIAQQHGSAVVVVAHLNKARGGDPLYRVGGSIGIPAAVRSALLLARDPSDEERGRKRVLAHVKCNVAPQAESLACEVQPILLESDERIETARMVVTGTSDVLAKELLDLPTSEEKTERVEAMDFLRAELAYGPRHVQGLRVAATGAGLSWRTIERAKGDLGVKSHRVGGAAGEGRWEWSLPRESKAATTNTAAPISANGGVSERGSTRSNTDPSRDYHRHSGDMADNAADELSPSPEERLAEREARVAASSTYEEMLVAVGIGTVPSPNGDGAK